MINARNGDFNAANGFPGFVSEAFAGSELELRDTLTRQLKATADMRGLDEVVKAVKDADADHAARAVPKP